MSFLDDLADFFLAGDLVILHGELNHQSACTRAERL